MGSGMVSDCMRFNLHEALTATRDQNAQRYLFIGESVIVYHAAYSEPEPFAQKLRRGGRSGSPLFPILRA